MAKVLVAYASKHGSTAEIAAAVAEDLGQAGLSVDCVATGEVASLADYDAVVLGSAVYMRRWRGEAARFLRRHAEELSQRPFWVFSSGPTGEPQRDPDPSWLEPPRIMAKVEGLGARGHVVFGGQVPTSPRGPIEHAIVKNTPEAYRDRRDWAEIHAWATRVAAEISASQPLEQAASK